MSGHNHSDKPQHLDNTDHHAHHHHSANGRSHQNHMSMPGMAQVFLRKFYLVTLLLLPLFVLSEPGLRFLGYSDFALRRWLLLAVATVIFWIGRVFFEHASHEIKSRQYGMMTLVSMGVGAGYLFSAVTTFFPALEVEFYLEVSTLIWVLLFGHYLEARSSTAAGDALQEVAKLLPKTAHLIKGKATTEVEISQLKPGDIVMAVSYTHLTLPTNSRV